MIILKKNGYPLNMQKIKLRKLKERLIIRGTMIGKSIFMNLQKGN